jgi:hypothetical protein
MNSEALLRQYVDTGLPIPEHQFNGLSDNLKKTYIRKRNLALEDGFGEHEEVGGSVGEVGGFEEGRWDA